MAIPRGSLGEVLDPFALFLHAVYFLTNMKIFSLY